MDEAPSDTGIPGFEALSILVAILCFLGLKRRTNRLNATNATKSHTH